jgi:hypothetical protein
MLLNPIKRRSLLRPIRSGREFCWFVKPAVSPRRSAMPEAPHFGRVVELLLLDETAEKVGLMY